MRINPNLGLPSKYTEWRPEQWEALNKIRASKKNFLLDAPTGTGKSLLSVGLHRYGLIENGQSAVYLVQTKQLQEQIMRDFSSIAYSLKGKNNYPCLFAKDKFPEVSAEDCGDKPSSCYYYDVCPYFAAKKIAKESPLVVLNYAYFLNESNSYMSAFSGRDLMIADEFDSIESALRSYIECKITKEQLMMFDIDFESDKKSDWLEKLPGIVLQLQELESTLDWEIHDFIQPYSPEQLLESRRFRRLQSFIKKLQFLLNECRDWIFIPSGREWIFKPVLVSDYTQRFLWNHAGRILGMSGTILNPAIESKDLGINEYDYFQLQSTFPVQNRPIYYTPVTDVSYKNMQSALPKLRDLLGETIDQYPNGKILVHTVSYDIRNYLMNNLRTDREIITHDTSTRTEMLNHFKESKNSVIMSPSFDRGVDLPEEDNCQCVFVCKMPFMNLGDPQVKARKALPDGAEWYALKALQSLMQMTGRSVRSNTQKCDTVIADSNFARLRYLTRFYIPKWWSDAIINKPIKVRF